MTHARPYVLTAAGSRRITLVVNAAAGAGHEAHGTPELAAALAADGADVEVIAAEGPDIAEAAKRAVTAGQQIVVAGGGDGTISAVASALAGSRTILGVLPLGTLNHFAKDLGIPLNPKAAAEVILRGVVRRVDMGDVNGHLFLNNSSLGLYPQVVRGREARQRSGQSKWTAVAHSTLEALRFLRVLQVRITIDGQTETLRAPFVFVGNNAYTMEGLQMGERPRLDGGVLSVYLAKCRSPWSLVLLAFHAAFGRLKQTVFFETRTARVVEIEIRHRHLHVALDGEVIPLTNPLLYRIRPGALSVMAPATKGCD